MPDIRRYLVIAVIAILFTILVQVSIEAAYPEPKYEDYCKPEYRPKPIMTPPPNYQCPNYNPPPMISEECERQKGYVQYRTDQYGCATEAYCETCQHKLDDAREKYNFVVFIVSALMGLIALVIGLNLSQETNPINEWVGSGFLLGGIIRVRRNNKILRRHGQIYAASSDIHRASSGNIPSIQKTRKQN
jgi:hypothetical protein